MPAIPFVGANDAGSSTGALVELARALSGTRRTHDVYIVFFDGEEAYVSYTDADGFYGSRHLAERWASEELLDNIIALVNIDMIGDQDLGILREWTSDDFLVEMIWDVAGDLGYGEHFLSSRGSVMDDHVAFLERGVPAVDLIDFDYGPNNSYWHTPRDTMNKLSADSLEVVGRVLVETLRRLDQLGE
jgi:Zn-dependent M28 family amino/carboxypeptidase